MKEFDGKEYLNEAYKRGRGKGLVNITMLLELLGNPHKNLKCIHIAGTNGKGSVGAIVSNILIKAGFLVSHYSSPHLVKYNERFRINNKNISDKDLDNYLYKINEKVKELNKIEIFPTEFDILTALMFLYSNDNKVDYLVLEVGLGGRLDSTNIVEPIVSVITSISFDHTNVLGDTLEKIAYEKLGIVKKNIPVFTTIKNNHLINSFNKVILDRGLLNITSDNYNYSLNKTNTNLFYNNKEYIIGIIGDYQVYNAMLAIDIANYLRVDYKLIYEGLKTVVWPGRMEIISNNPTFIIDGSHNKDSAKFLVNTLNDLYKDKKITAIFGMREDKDMKGVIKELKNIFDTFIITEPLGDMVYSTKDIKEELNKYNIDSLIIKDYKEAVKKALNSKNDIIVCFGSFYLIGAVRKLFIND